MNESNDIKPRILVVDDDATVLEMILDGLEKHDFEMVSAQNPTEANKQLITKDVSIALLDLDLGWPHKNGIEYGQELREKSKNIIVIIMTGYQNIQHAVNAMREFDFHYMIKPFRIDQIVSLIDRARLELKLVNENESLRIQVEKLKSENEKLKNLVKEFIPEAGTQKIGQQDKAKKQAISSDNVVSSYQRQQKTNLPGIQKNNKVR